MSRNLSEGNINKDVTANEFGTRQLLRRPAPASAATAIEIVEAYSSTDLAATLGSDLQVLVWGWNGYYADGDTPTFQIDHDTQYNGTSGNGSTGLDCRITINKPGAYDLSLFAKGFVLYTNSAMTVEYFAQQQAGSGGWVAPFGWVPDRIFSEVSLGFQNLQVNATSPPKYADASVSQQPHMFFPFHIKDTTTPFGFDMHAAVLIDDGTTGGSVYSAQTVVQFSMLIRRLGDTHA